MRIVKGTVLNMSELTEAEPILFYLKDGIYFYVCSGIVDNELRVLKNWRVGERSSDEPWLITHQQGCQIPQELGDYLVEQQNENLH